MICEMCGCTDEMACIDIRTGEPCHWTRPGLCSCCDELGGPGLAIRTWPLPERGEVRQEAEANARKNAGPVSPLNKALGEAVVRLGEQLKTETVRLAASPLGNRFPGIEVVAAAILQERQQRGERRK